MQIIPVIDVKGGMVVHAQGGDREAYRLLETPLAPSAHPISVVKGLINYFPFRGLYVADLNGIVDGVADVECIGQLASAFANLEIWLDNGMPRSGADTSQLCKAYNIRPVIGTETLQSVDEFVAVNEALKFSCGRSAILSLDLKGGAILGADLLGRPELWPDTVVAMTLDAVGARAGPDIQLIRRLHELAPTGTRVVAAGGVRGKVDAVALHAAGAEGALVATALHTQTLKAGDLLQIAGLPTGSVRS